MGGSETSAQHVALLANGTQSVRTFRLPLIQALVRAGHRVTVIAPGADEAFQTELAALGAQGEPLSLDRTGLNPLNDVGFLIRLTRVLRGLKPDCLLTFMIKPNVYGALAGRRAGVARIYGMVEGLGYPFTDGPGPKRRLARLAATQAYRAALPRMTGAIFLNPDDRALFLDRKILTAADKGFVLDGIGVDLDRFAPTPPPTDPVTFLFIGRLIKDKGVAEFLEAARAVKTRWPEVRFTVLGAVDANPSSGPGRLFDEAVAAGIVSHPGHVADVRPYLEDASVFVLPSYREGLPRTGLEALAMGRAVIVTDVPGCREIVRHGVNGWLVPARAAEALAAAMGQAVMDPARIGPMGAASRALAEDRFDERRIHADFLRLTGLAP